VGYEVKLGTEEIQRPHHLRLAGRERTLEHRQPINQGPSLTVEAYSRSEISSSSWTLAESFFSKPIQLYHSYDGALVENVDIETAIKHLAVLNKKLKDDDSKSITLVGHTVESRTIERFLESPPWPAYTSMNA
jgi:hypothetical protein